MWTQRSSEPLRVETSACALTVTLSSDDIVTSQALNLFTAHTGFTLPVTQAVTLASWYFRT